MGRAPKQRAAPKQKSAPPQMGTALKQRTTPKQKLAPLQMEHVRPSARKPTWLPNKSSNNRTRRRPNVNPKPIQRPGTGGDRHSVWAM